MKERPILYSAPMVLAKLAGRKTQTRRIVKPQTEHRPIGWGTTENGGGGNLRCPYGRPGDLLWGREAWCTRLDLDHARPRDLHPEYGVTYRADHPGESSSGCAGGFGRWRPSIFMPRWASRLLDEVVSVRIERLGDISEEDALAEGISVAAGRDRPAAIGPGQVYSWPGGETLYVSARSAYFAGWDTINGKGAAAKNPWVWRVETRPAR